ncbi:hypothetical protein ACFFJB_07540 [Camelimonas abortus]|uniref:Uncharacterized protein n=1 Tax=Camelimonas abortus TaxID=1017184 RepID=A0ABV7LG25_9HYPH
MLSDTAMMITGLAFAAIAGGAWLLRRRAMADAARPAQPAQAARPVVRPSPPFAGAGGAAFPDPGVTAPAHSQPAMAAVARAAARVPAAARGTERAEAQALRAALADALEHLAEIYGVEYLDAFEARRMRRNITPCREMAAAATDPELARTGAEQADRAEKALRGVVAEVRARLARASEGAG